MGAWLWNSALRRLWAVTGALAIGAAVCAAAAEPSLYYAGPTYVSQKVRSDPFALRKHLYPALKEAGIRRIELVAGRDSVVQERSPSGMMYLDGLPSEALHAVLVVLRTEFVGAAAHILFEGKGTEANPDRVWTVRRDLEGRIVIVKGGPALALDGPDPRPEQLTARFGIGPVLDSGDSHWSASELRALEKALELLAPRELELAAGVSFTREKINPLGRAGECRFGSDGAPSSIAVFDRAFELQQGAVLYVGSPEQVVPYAVFPILHELGHVISSEERRRVSSRIAELRGRHLARSARYEAQLDEYNRDRARAMAGGASAEFVEHVRRSLEALDREHAELTAEAQAFEAMYSEAERLRDGSTSIESSYAALPGALEGPTPYGRTNVQESFAEAFALYHLDPDTLRWLTPSVHAWFAASAHLGTSDE